ncbi:unannotated protein [freshwater metagenome]|uniref:Unannotated protein n=1 Tax=freshwater metagenome TaxID=449393 RepID=A0A6J7QGA5_9ZZZZ
MSVIGEPRRQTIRGQHLNGHLEAARRLGHRVAQRVEQSVAEHPELQRIEHLVHALTVDGSSCEVVGVVEGRGQRDIAHHLGEPSVELHRFEVITQ